MKKILVVDDEVQILKALSRMFLETDYEILTAENGQEALELIETTPVDMIISDMRMPVLDGYQLLSIVKEKYPGIIRIILSGYTEEKPMFRALLHNIATLYVFKPWNNSVLLESINKLFANSTELHSTDLSDIIRDLGCTSCIPENCEKMISLVEAEDMDQLIAEMENDPDISSLLHQVTSSAVYGVMPNTVKQAAIYIGLPNLKCFLHWACIISATKQTREIAGESELLWKHAYLTNRIMLFFYEAFLHKQPPDSAMFAGLLHNIGLIIIADALQKKGLIDQRSLTANDYIRMENGEYEKEHQDIGAYFLDQWDIPFQMYEAALNHHKPMQSSIIFKELVYAVHLAQAYAWRVLEGTEQLPVAPELYDELGISQEDFEKRLFRYLK
ncbi:MAG TPA: HDOD domain-containing protein [Clostridiales bacterium]|nr:HDOD domain-containing protein [Clostridiales bacterium]